MSVNIDEIRKLLGKNGEKLKTSSKVVVYDFFEAKGDVSASQAVLTARLYLNFIKYGAKIVLCFGDWVANLNGRFGGDFNKIRMVSFHYIEILKALGICFGDKDNEVSLVFQKDYLGNLPNYWEVSLDILQLFSSQYLSHIANALLMNPIEKDSSASNVLLPCHLISNIFFSISQQKKSSLLSTDTLPSEPSFTPFFAHLKSSFTSSSSSSSSSDSSPATSSSLNTSTISPSSSSVDVGTIICPDIVLFQPEFEPLEDLLIKYCDLKGLDKPVILCKSILPLTKPGDLISQASDIFVEETTKDIQKKITKAFFDAENMATSPLVNWLETLLLPLTGSFLLGGRAFSSFAEIEPLIKDRTLSIKDFKEAIAAGIDAVLQPVRAHFFSTPPLQSLHAGVRAVLEGRDEKQAKGKPEKKSEKKEKEKK